MSSRELKKVMQDKRIQEIQGVISQVSKVKGEHDAERCSSGDEQDAPVAVNKFQMLDDIGNSSSNEDVENTDMAVPSQQKESSSSQAAKPKKNKRKKKKGAAKKKELIEDDDELMSKYIESTGASSSAVNENAETQKENDIFAIETKYLYPEDELRRKIGTKVPKRNKPNWSQAQHQVLKRSARLVHVKPNWPIYSKTGLSMKLVETKSDCSWFAFEHNHQYQSAQFAFLEAVERMVPDNFVEILRQNPYHVDSLLQLSQIVAQQEDFAAAAGVVEQALYGCECAFHPLFNVTGSNRRLDYRQAENRPFFQAVFRHIMLISQRGCTRTALEFCKFLYSLNPVDDPCGAMLLIDYLAIKSDQLDYMIRLFETLDPFKNLSLLPSMSYSYAMALMLRNADGDRERSTAQLEDAVLRFPSFVPDILDKLSVEPDSIVESHSFFKAAKFDKESTGLKQLVALYIARTHQLWKEPNVLLWLEETMHALLAKIDTGGLTDKMEKYKKIRRTRYHGTPENILRHVYMSGNEASVPDLPSQTVMSYDPIPPTDSRRNYSLPTMDQRMDRSFLSRLLRSLHPMYTPEMDIVDANAPVEAQPGDGGLDFQRSVQDLLQAVRNLLGDVQPVPPPIAGAGGHAGDWVDDPDHEDDDDAWQ